MARVESRNANHLANLNGRKFTSIALVDLDGTLIKGSSAEKLFLSFLIRTGRLSVTRGIFFGVQFFWISVLRGIDVAKGRCKGFLKGVKSDELEKWIDEFMPYLTNQISEGLKREIFRLRNQGLLMVLLSGSLQVFLNRLRRLLQADLAIGVELEWKRGRATGWSTGMHPFGDNKARIVRELFQASIDWENSWAFADRYSDLPVLEMVGQPVVVNPDRKLRKLAEKRGWSCLLT